MAVQTISYTDKVALNENASIADINKITDDDMNSIKSVVNNNATETSNNSTAISNLQIYSSTETNTGKVWINNKPIYRIVLTRSGAGSIDISSLNVDVGMIDYTHSFCKSTSNRWTSIVSTTTTASSTGAWQISAYINNTFTSITIEKGSSASLGDVVITLEYTKTTD